MAACALKAGGEVEIFSTGAAAWLWFSDEHLTLLKRPGVMLGSSEDISYHRQAVSLGAADILLWASDGLIDGSRVHKRLERHWLSLLSKDRCLATVEAALRDIGVPSALPDDRSFVAVWRASKEEIQTPPPSMAS